MGCEKLDGLIDIHGQHIAHRTSTPRTSSVSASKRRPPQCSHSTLTSGQETHLDRALALHRRTRGSGHRGVEGEAAGAVAADARFLAAGVDAADVVPEADIGRRAGSRRASNRCLVDFEHAGQLLCAEQASGCARRRMAPGSERGPQACIQYVARQSGFSGAGHASDHDQPAERYSHPQPPQVVQRDAFELQRGCRPAHRPPRLACVPQWCRQHASGDRQRVAQQLLGGALRQ